MEPAAAASPLCLHDARPPAATVLLILGVPAPTVMTIMGWSSVSMAERYQHVVDSIRTGVARQAGGLLWNDQRAAVPAEAEEDEWLPGLP
ncbi:tyrosine-type recombinase/integrase [Actinocorallia longicatena]|uniref:Tyr recombinase domain-containing protein n=1 Tax=Actinocorallia longicatena TaxID=111803 RepID=A0ABP6Q9R5_9ACTN